MNNNAKIAEIKTLIKIKYIKKRNYFNKIINMKKRININNLKL
jgi:hypothetical protein